MRRLGSRMCLHCFDILFDVAAAASLMLVLLFIGFVSSTTLWRSNVMVKTVTSDEIEANRRPARTSVVDVEVGSEERSTKLSQSLLVALERPTPVRTTHSSALKLPNGDHHVSREGSYCSCYYWCWWTHARTDCMNKFRGLIQRIVSHKRGRLTPSKHWHWCCRS